MAPFSFERRQNMDVRQYYRKLRDIEASISEPYLLVVSLETADGGKQGAVSEVSRYVAAKLILEGRAVLASEKEKLTYLEQQATAKKASYKADLARRVQVAIIADSDLEAAACRNNNELGSGK